MADKLTTAQAAILADCSKWTVYKAVDAGKLNATKHGRDWQYKPEDVEEWAQTLHRKPGRPKSGRFTQADAARMLGITRQRVGQLMRSGVDLSAPEAVVEWALYDKAVDNFHAEMCHLNSATRIVAEDWLGVNYVIWYDASKHRFAHILDQALSLMREVAPLKDWRVVK